MRTNYHTHTPRCKHASGSGDEFVQAAIAHGYQALGFTDHGPWPYESGYVSNIRMETSELEGYVAEVRGLANKYRGQIQVYCGFESEYFPAYMGWLRDTVQAYQLDYLILGNHFDSTDEGGIYFGGITEARDLWRYVTQTMAGMETGLYRILAHPDVYLRSMPRFDAVCKETSREICRAANALGVTLEFNLLGLRYCSSSHKKPDTMGYPCEAFWEVAAEEQCATLVGVDAHHLAHLRDPELYDLAARYLDMLGVRRVETLVLP